jgi:hypothetical protein
MQQRGDDRMAKIPLVEKPSVLVECRVSHRDKQCSIVSTGAYVIEDHTIDAETNATVIGLAIRLAFLGAAHVCLLTALIVGATDAAATPLNPFRYEAQARRHCPVDTVVWLDFRKGIYYFKQQKRYAQGSTGSFVCREEARGNGYRRSLLGLR